MATRRYQDGGQVPGRPLSAGDLALLRMAATEELEKKQDMSAFVSALERRAAQLKRKAEEERKSGDKQNKPLNVYERLPNLARGGRVPAKPASPRTAAPARPTSKAAPARPAARPASRPSSGGGRKGR